MASRSEHEAAGCASYPFGAVILPFSRSGFSRFGIWRFGPDTYNLIPLFFLSSSGVLHLLKIFFPAGSQSFSICPDRSPSRIELSQF